MTSQIVRIDLDDTPVRSKCEHVASDAYEASLICGGFRLDLAASSLDQIDDVIEQLQIDVACLRAQQEQKNAGTAA